MEKKVSRLAILLKFALFCGVIFMPIFTYFIYKINSTLPSIKVLMEYNPDKATYIYDANNQIMGEIANEKRIFVSIEHIPAMLKNAFIAAEDKTFYENSGIDFAGLAKAMIRNIVITVREPGSRYTGASTITQQVVRNILLSNERTVTRKIKEMLLAYKINKELSKDKILEIYLNQIYLGSRSYGVAAAAKEYFGKTLNELTISEMALLASLPKAPSAIDPHKSMARAIERRNYVLHRMLDEKYITETDYEVNKKESITIVHQKPKYIGESFVDYVRNIMYQGGVSENELLTAGYRINTTMRKKWQEIAQKSLNEGIIRLDRSLNGYRGPITQIDTKDWLKNLKNTPLPVKINDYQMAVVLGFDKNSAIIGLTDGTKSNILLSNSLWVIPGLSKLKTDDPAYNTILSSFKLQNILKIGDVIVVDFDGKKHSLQQVPEIDGAVVIMSPKNGDLYAIVGGYADIRASFNRAFQAKRQAGSAAKVFVYLAALEAGISPAEIFMDSEISYSVGDGAVWAPRNWTRSYRGPVTMRTGFEASINTITLRIAEKIGLSRVIKTMKKAQFTKEKIESNYGICLGTSNTTLLDLANSFAIIANYGNNIKPRAISKIEANGKAVYLKLNSDGNQDEIRPELADEPDLEDLMQFENTTEEERIFGEQSSYQMLSLLTGAVERGTASALKTLNFTIGAKTGTSQGGQSLWAIGVTPDVVIGVYAGYDIPKDTDVFAASATMPILTDIFSKLKPDLAKSIFKVPDGIKMVKIDKKTGKKTHLPLGKDIIYEAFKDSDKILEEETEESNNIKKDNNKDHFNGVY